MLETDIKKLTEAVVALTAVMSASPHAAPAAAPDPIAEKMDAGVKAEAVKTEASKAAAAAPKKVEAPTGVSVDEVRERLRAVLTKCGPEGAKAVLKENGATSITTLDEAKYESVMTGLDALLAAAELD